MKVIIAFYREAPNDKWPEGFLWGPTVEGDLAVGGYEYEIECDKTAGWRIPPPGAAGESVTVYELVEVS